ncbi:hypothetical protein DRE_02727 [Drechslerella stenobrocha 248]|uniref:Uncharacterized protein n=1 Tax=Drechslerella stenobrocha 248 TaxID=1043628 RepID=W7IFD6_9PEZI|nr:hypothetical protein DRE_02727 [Drechslerella stenobrocha 248]
MELLPSASRGNLLMLFSGLFPAYLLLVRKLRYRRLQKILDALEIECGTVRKSSEVPLRHAEAIIRNIANSEFPQMMMLSLQFALFRTYGIPSISTILWKSRQFAERSTAHRRYVDTVVLIAEAINTSLDSPRGKLAIERINYLHGRYRISNGDLLYTLILFMCQPGVFIDKYEWRNLHPIEKMGLHRFWNQVGDMMGIDGIPDSYEGCYQWANEYETKNMVSDEVNVKVAVATVDLLLHFVPGPLKGPALPVIHAICDPNLRASFFWPDPPSYIEPLINHVFAFRAFVIRNFFLPRLSSAPRIECKAINGSVPLIERRYYVKIWDTDPWYYRRTWWNSYGPTAWLCRIMGWGVPSDEFNSVAGYRVGEVGPKATVGKGPGNAGWEPGSYLAATNLTRVDDNERFKGAAESGGRCPMFAG